MSSINVGDLKDAALSELSYRRSWWHKHQFSDRRNGRSDFYGTTGAVNIFSILGVPFASARGKRKLASSIRSFQKRDGTFPGGNGAEHSLAMAVQALNLLQADLPPWLAPLAPTDEVALPNWLDKIDWSSTHKVLWGAVAPLLAGNRVSAQWKSIYFDFIRSKISPERPLETWCEKNAPPRRVVSSVYHVLATYDAGALPYPHPDILVQRMLDLEWHKLRATEKRTFCTDGDWAWILTELCKLVPERFSAAMEQILSVSSQRVDEWCSGRVNFEHMSTHHIYCYLWVTARFQRIDRGSIRGGPLLDTLNSPHLFRI